MKIDSYTGKKVLILGLGLSGRSAAYFLMQQGAVVTGVDQNENLLNSHHEILVLKQAGLKTHVDLPTQQVQEFDLIVVSPGIPQTHPLYHAAIQANCEVIGEIELGLRSVKNPIIGITGTNGKTTVTLLVTHILNQSGKPAKALGNVGVPLTKELLTINPEDVIVLELSSYQLETLFQPVLSVGVILNITPDHLDRYGQMEAYAKAKFYMERCLKPGRPLYIEERALKEYGHLLHDAHVRSYGYSSHCFIHTDQQHLFVQNKKEWSWPKSYQGKKNHEIENILAAYALCREWEISPSAFIHACMSFKKPAHRIEFVLERKGIKYYDDSKGTNIDAVIRAVQFVDGPIILIAGGKDKGASYMPWLEAFVGRVKYICAIGQAADKIQRQLSPFISVKIYKDLDEAVTQASEVAQEGDTILLSPGCSSLDMFRDYTHRGEEFQRVVRELEKRKDHV